ncbi:MAG: LCP family protein [Dietzia sp.]|nr:LCP family protein [Dietzia sp.]
MAPPQRTGASGAVRERRAPAGSWDTADTYLSVAQARRRAVSLLVLSVLVPGSAQIVAGNRAIGRIVLRIWFGILLIAALLGGIAFLSISTVVGILSASWFLRLAQWALYAWAAIWALVLIDAWRLGRPDYQPTRTRRRFAIATVILLVLPAGVAYAGTSVSAGRSALSAVFADGPSIPPSDGRYNILLLGGDSGAGREGTRPDSLQLVSIDADTGRAVTFGFARDTSNIVFERGSVMAGIMPEGWTCGDECLLNGLYTWAMDHKDQFPPDVEDPGILATREAVEALSGLEVQYYALVDLNGFRSLVDALGGLEINVIRRTPIGGGTSKISSWIEPGNQRLDGYHALWYARSREGSSNYERMARQRCVMSAMVDQIDPRTIALRFGDLAAASTGVLRTDIPQSDLGTFAELALKTRSQKITGVNFVPPLIKPWDFDIEEMHRIVEDTIEASEKTADEEAVSTSATPLPGVTPTDAAAPGGAQVQPGAPDSSQGSAGATHAPGYDPLARPSEDINARTDDIASVCSVG